MSRSIYIYKQHNKMKTESKIQQEIFIYFKNNYCLEHHKPPCVIFSVPNGGTRNQLEAMTLKATGLLPGVSDLIILLPNSTAIFVEVKTQEGFQSPKQKDFEQKVKSLGFRYYWLVRSLEEFKAHLNHVYPLSMVVALFVAYSTI